MSVFSCRELAVDWQIAPKTPHLYGNGGLDFALNYDDYSDREQGLQPDTYQTQYPNVPDVFPSETSVNDTMDWDTARAVMQAVPEGGVCWFEDGVYDYSAAVQTFLDISLACS